MIQIRSSFFETNSSSCHVFVYNTKEDVSVPNVVELHPDSRDNMLDILFNDHYIWYRGRDIFDDDMTEFIDSLYSIGVKTIKCNFDNKLKKLIRDRKDNFSSHYAYNKEAFKRVLFGQDTKLEVIEDYMDFDKIVKKEYGKDYDYISRRLS